MDKTIIFEIKILDNMIIRKIIMNAKTEKIPYVLSPIQTRIMHYLFENSNRPIYQRDIEKVIQARRSTTSGILNTMEKNKLIIREVSKKDARTKQIFLTSHSNKICHQLIDKKEKFEVQLKEGITSEELDTFFKVTEKIKQNINNM